MSDYGASIVIQKKNGRPVTAEELEMVKAEVEDVQHMGEFTDHRGETFLFEISHTANEGYVFVVLSKYAYGEGDDEENFELAEENDLGQAEEVATLLESRLGQVFDLEPGFDNWS